MKSFLCITIDVEPDCSPTWHYSNPLQFTGVSEGIAQKLHPLFLQFGVQPTYLINNVVLENDESVEVFKNLKGDFELGTHLHGDFIEPEKLHYDYAGKDGVQNQCFLKPEIEFGKLENLTGLFKKKFGYQPVSFRAGRFSAGKNTIASLRSLGYKVDTSVTPKIIWNDPSRESSVDYRMSPDQPFWTSSDDFPYKSQQEQLLQVPVSIIETKRHLFFKRRLWLRPYYSTGDQMVKVSETLMKKHSYDKIVVLNMMFHNVEVMPLLSPYTKTETELTNYLDSMKHFFEYCSKKNIEPATLSEVHDNYTA